MEEIELTGYVNAVMIAGSHESLESVRFKTVTTTFEGIEGDCHSGYTRKSGVREKNYYLKGTIIRNNRQISIVSFEELEMIATQMGIEKILPEWLGANICIDGFPNLTQLPELTRLVFPSGAVIVIYGENTPCIYPGNIIAQHNKKAYAPDFPKFAMNKRGLVGWVESPGVISESDAVKVQFQIKH